jgi:hypothetical protein
VHGDGQIHLAYQASNAEEAAALYGGEHLVERMA